MPIDFGLALLACYSAYVLRFGGELVPASLIVRYQALSLGAAAGWVVAARAAGLYSRAALRRGASNVEPTVGAAFCVGLALWIVEEIVTAGSVSRGWVGLVTLLLIVAGVGSRALVRRLRRILSPLGLGLERYALVGSGPAVRRLRNDLTRAPGAPFELVGDLPGELGPDEIAARARELHLDGLIMLPGSPAVQVAQLAASLAGEGIDVLLAPEVGQLDLRVASIAILHGVPLLRAAGLNPRRRGIRSAARKPPGGVAILGTRGIPANYGGFETFAERLALHLVAHGIPTTVYCRTHFATEESTWRGIRLITLPTIRNKYLDTVVHTFGSALHLILRGGPRNVILCNAANAPVIPLLRAAGRRVVLNVDGLEWRRSKWGSAGRTWYRMGEWMSVRLASVLVTDAEEVRTYYRVRHDSDSVMIPYGADLLERGSGQLPAAIPVVRDGYVLYVSRWEPENNPVLVAAAHAASGVELPLVMLGSAAYAPDLDVAVRRAAAATAVLPGAVYGAGYRALQANARCYIQATEVGGTHPALIEAMGAGNLCLVLDTPENREVAGPGGAWFFADETELTELLRRVERLDRGELSVLRTRTRDWAAAQYSWSSVGEAYLTLLGGSVPSDLKPSPIVSRDAAGP